MNYSSIVSTELASALEILPRITSSNLYERCKSLIEDITIVQFKSDISKWLSDGTIPGYETRKGIRGGIYKKNSSEHTFIKYGVTEDIKLDSEPESSFTFQISPTLRIVQSDDRNWTIQKKSGESWQNKYYHNKLSSIIESAIRHIINDEFKASSDTVIQLKDIVNLLNNMENKLTVQLQDVLKQ